MLVLIMFFLNHFHKWVNDSFCLLVLWNLETPKKIQKGDDSLVSFVVCAKILPLGGQKQNFSVAHSKVFSEKKKCQSCQIFEEINCEIKVVSQ
jgi:hypothetical protein